MDKKEKIEFLSYTYKKDGKKFTAKVKPKPRAKKTLAAAKETNCACGQQKCEEGFIWRCMPLDDEGTCAWFITNEHC